MQSWEWGLVKSDGGDWRAIRLIAIDQTNKIVGGIAILARSFPLIGALYYAPRGPILADWSQKTVLEALLDSVRQRGKNDGAMALKIDPAIPSDRHDLLATLKGLGFQRPADQDAQGFGGTQPKAVMILDIAGKSEDELLMIFKAQCRRNVRIAEKKGVTVISECTREHLVPFYDLLKITGERDGFTIRPFSYYETLWYKLVENNLAKLFLTQFEGQYLSGALCFNIGDKAVYVYGASSNENRNVMPNYAMQWAMIKWARDKD
jgi:lipid II:glycine glycyltransferase (peptidoglycan interpeptide bridge formation enzyme)